MEMDILVGIISTLVGSVVLFGLKAYWTWVKQPPKQPPTGIDFMKAWIDGARKESKQEDNGREIARGPLDMPRLLRERRDH